jgi:hypothetical protein
MVAPAASLALTCHGFGNEPGAAAAAQADGTANVPVHHRGTASAMIVG